VLDFSDALTWSAPPSFDEWTSPPPGLKLPAREEASAKADAS
jgi:hypothetical protein